MKQKIRNWVLIASSCFIFVFLATPGVFAQGSNFRAEFDSYLTRFGFGDQGITSDADRAIRREFVQFIGNGSVNLDELEPEELDRLLADPVRRERLVNSFTTYHQSGALPEPTYAPPASSALNESTTIVPDVNDPTKSDFQLIPANCYGSGDTAYVETKNKGGCGWKDLIILINIIVKFLVYIAASLSAIAIAYAGFLYMTAMGNSGKIEQAHGIFTKTLIGIFFILVGWLLVATVLKILGVEQAFSIIDISQVKEIK